jgi:hypothetical protein
MKLWRYLLSTRNRFLTSGSGQSWPWQYQESLGPICAASAWDAARQIRIKLRRLFFIFSRRIFRPQNVRAKMKFIVTNWNDDLTQPIGLANWWSWMSGGQSAPAQMCTLLVCHRPRTIASAPDHSDALKLLRENPNPSCISALRFQYFHTFPEWSSHEVAIAVL